MKRKKLSTEALILVWLIHVPFQTEENIVLFISGHRFFRTFWAWRARRALRALVVDGAVVKLGNAVAPFKPLYATADEWRRA